MKLEKKPRVGIWIEGTQDEKDALFLDVKGEHDLVESLFERIPKRLHFSTDIAVKK